MPSEADFDPVDANTVRHRLTGLTITIRDRRLDLVGPPGRAEELGPAAFIQIRTVARRLHDRRRREGSMTGP